MTRSRSAGHGFGDRAALAASRLKNTIAASLAIGSLSLCLIVTLTMLSIRMVAAMPM
ncbi:hypothetical protein [Bradyrhizobium prioriisuperbiae]|uniref:hypothetical protein n=1 Tax=Bradyrhizobium prioriisuperbiae TaxID=2854389 RepID=UPI0028E82611|nr:hypothetical protein [Bradyrhizobium prioritasuperba]